MNIIISFLCMEGSPLSKAVMSELADLPVKALSHLDDLANVCRRMKNLSKTLAHVEYVMGKF